MNSFWLVPLPFPGWPRRFAPTLSIKLKANDRRICDYCMPSQRPLTYCRRELIARLGLSMGLRIDEPVLWTSQFKLLQGTAAMPKYGTVRVDDVAEKLQSMTDCLNEVGKELRAALRKQKPKKASKAVLRDAAAIATSAPDGLAVAKQWIQFNGVVDAASLHAALEMDRGSLCISSACSAAPIDETVAGVPHDKPLSCRARKFLVDSNLMSWLETQSLQKGLAPVRTQVWQQRLRLNSCPVKISKTKKGQRQWCKRWRRRWGVAAGRIHCREIVTEKDMQEKVGARSLAATAIHGFRFGVHPHAGPQQNLDHLVALVSGPCYEI